MAGLHASRLDNQETQCDTELMCLLVQCVLE